MSKVLSILGEWRDRGVWLRLGRGKDRLLPRDEGPGLIGHYCSAGPSEDQPHFSWVNSGSW